eukprot:1977613-Alexandrium_andersonii.AAC.1
MSGRSICGHYRVVLTDYVGDWKFTADSCHFTRTWATEEVCEHCHASQSGTYNFVNFNHDAPSFAKPRLNSEYMASKSAELSPLTAIVGWHVHMVRPDVMHAGPLGVI